MIEITYNEKKTVKVITDSENPRIYKKEIKCSVCGNWTDEDDVYWDKDIAYCSDCPMPETEDSE